MILAIKSLLPLEKLKMCNFYSGDMVFLTHIAEIHWYYFNIPENLYNTKLIDYIVTDDAIMEFSFDEALVANTSSEIIPTNANFANQWGFRNIGQYSGFPGEDARVTRAWDVETGSFDIIVAVVDSGVDVDHECLVGQIYVDSTETNILGVDSDGNGYKNDFIGWNTEANNYRSYTSSHGTALASIITTNGNGMSGVTWKTRIMPIAIGNITAYDIPQVRFYYPCSCGDSSCSAEDTYSSYYSAIPSSRVSAGIIYAANKGAHIINVAYSRANTGKIGCCATYPYATYLPDVRDAIKYAGRMGCVVVTAAGDWLPESVFPTPRHGTASYTEDCGGVDVARRTGDRNIFPGAYARYFPFQINVTAHTNWGYLYYDKVYTSRDAGSYSGWLRGCAYSASNVNIAAPGKDILVATPGNSYGLAGGTSVASAFVAGAAALIWSRNSYLKNYEIVDILQSTSRKSAYWAARVACGGVLDVESAVKNV